MVEVMVSIIFNQSGIYILVLSLSILLFWGTLSIFLNMGFIYNFTGQHKKFFFFSLQG